MPISIYNYQNSKIPLMLELAESYLERHYAGEYYLDNDWENGPNTIIIFKDPNLEASILESIKAIVAAYKEKHPVSKEEVHKKAEKYARNQHTLKQLELRDMEGHAQTMRADGTVELRSRKNNAFNSQYHQDMFDHYRTRLNSLYLDMMRIYIGLDTFHQTHMFLYMYHYLTSLYEDGSKRGYLSFLSHVEGFFSRLRLEGHNIDMKSEFERRRTGILKDNKIILHDELADAMDQWQQTWGLIAAEMNSQFRIENYQDESMLGLNEQYELLLENISPLDNSFHSELVRNKELKSFILSKKMLVFRDIINLFYLSLPIFEQSMVKKQFYAYCTVKFIEENHKEDLLFVLD
ncbi:hypothetical protein LQV63_14995 [Paenibacillus profundus]|uniref:Thiopeptide-type bacteriocin biosynthesis domain-containing protein n=1 Tax=Paenibacillus profundus TaxID=1173085 RepID=A0ABS8YF34_9BACL|nr:MULTISPECIES: hypothetical protein [Paenibacillus]MCE5170621.1 hypothetical protein [Paenibacillus profundus]